MKNSLILLLIFSLIGCGDRAHIEGANGAQSSSQVSSTDVPAQGTTSSSTSSQCCHESYVEQRSYIENNSNYVLAVYRDEGTLSSGPDYSIAQGERVTVNGHSGFGVSASPSFSPEMIIVVDIGGVEKVLYAVDLASHKNVVPEGGVTSTSQFYTLYEYTTVLPVMDEDFEI